MRNLSPVQQAIAHHKLTDTGEVLNGRSHNRKVIGPDGNLMVLKSAKIERYQLRLLLVAALRKGTTSFKTQKLFYPTSAVPNPEYLLLEYIEGQELKELYRTDLARTISISKAVCTDYQNFVQECQKDHTLPSHIDTEQAYGWMGRVFHAWIEKIMAKGLLSPTEAFQLSNTLFALARQDPQKFFGFVHGNIHGEHIILDRQQQPHLLDLTVEPRPGAAFYDVLRALDFALLEHPDPEAALPLIIKELKLLKTQHGEAAVQAVWALRCIGLLGVDILNNPPKANATDYPVREKIALAMIRGEY